MFFSVLCSSPTIPIAVRQISSACLDCALGEGMKGPWTDVGLAQ